jgi:hypothetical protein
MQQSMQMALHGGAGCPATDPATADPLLGAILTNASLAAMDIADGTLGAPVAPLLQELEVSTQRAATLYALIRDFSPSGDRQGSVNAARGWASCSNRSRWRSKGTAGLVDQRLHAASSGAIRSNAWRKAAAQRRPPARPPEVVEGHPLPRAPAPRPLATMRDSICPPFRSPR